MSGKIGIIVKISLVAPTHLAVSSGKIPLRKDLVGLNSKNITILSLLFVAVSALQADAGFVTVETEPLFAEVTGMATISAGSTRLTERDESDHRSEERELVHEQIRLADHALTPLDPGNSTSSTAGSQVSGSQVFVGIANLSESAVASEILVTPLFVRVSVYSPRMLIADIFRPPCALNIL